jgi:uncharacterized protein (DUF486 family)
MEIGMFTVLLLICSNAFMTVAWYGHLKFKTAPLLAAIFVSWLIALPEYMLQVPANRYGHASEEELEATGIHPESGWRRWWRMEFSAPQLKILQEVITISVFVVFNFLYLKEKIRPTDWAAFVLIILAVAVMMGPRILAERREHKVAFAPLLLPEDVAMTPVDGGDERVSG